MSLAIAEELVAPPVEPAPRLVGVVVHAEAEGERATPPVADQRARRIRVEHIGAHDARIEPVVVRRLAALPLAADRRSTPNMRGRCRRHAKTPWRR